MSEGTGENKPFPKRNRKKRKNFIANAKKYAKKGQMGRGTRMPEELYQYFVGILDVMKQGVEDKEERSKEHAYVHKRVIKFILHEKY